MFNHIFSPRFGLKKELNYLIFYDIMNFYLLLHVLRVKVLQIADGKQNSTHFEGFSKLFWSI